MLKPITIDLQGRDLGSQVCVLAYKNGEIVGWIIASGTQEARQIAAMSGDMTLAEILYRHEFTPAPGKYEIGPDYLMLVS